jgi:succinyl-diaminopimelate desuccinylase
VAEYSRKGVTVEASMRTTGEPFYCPPDHFTDIVQSAIRHHTGQTAHLSTSGGTSDARFIHRFCPVLELGLRNETAHKVDEHVEVEQMTTLKNIYADVIAGYFAAN